MNSIPARHGLLSNSSLDLEKTTAERSSSKWHHRFSRLFGRDDVTAADSGKLQVQGSNNIAVDTNAKETNGTSTPVAGTEKPAPARNRLGRQVIPGLPRPPTFKRQLSERRERLSPNQIPLSQRRSVSVDRRRAFSTRPASPTTFTDARTSAPAVFDLPSSEPLTRARSIATQPHTVLPQQPNINAMLMQRPANPPTPPPDEPARVPQDTPRRGSTAIDIQTELESRWILNLSMHFRDKSPREKFFVTYAETPTRWRRVTVSCDYRNAPPESLEADLHALQYQRDKSSRIYEAIRTSLPDIQFYDTVTNLRLETSQDERLHVHVTEDVNEIIPYPDKHLLSHLPSIPRIPEEKVHFLSHMSGFVYKVRVGGEILIKKEIPGPDSVEEFLYEINALSSLVGSKRVVQIRGLVTDEESNSITGLLIDYYEQGPLVDILFDHRGGLKWERKEKWAIQIIEGLSEIHEAGFVQGDFTVSNICVGADDNARIIDINRRGCPVGWEPPEIAAMIDSGQRISMYIGVKSDLFQLGMVLWAIANEDDEPERRERPLRLTGESSDFEIDPAPLWYRHITHLCLEPQSVKRLSANKLLESALALRDTPAAASEDLLSGETTTHTWTSASTAVPELPVSRNEERKARSPSSSSSLDELPRGRSPPRNAAHLGGDWRWDYLRGRASRQHSFLQEAIDAPRTHDIELDDTNDETDHVEPEIVPINPTGEGWREITVDGRGYIVRDDVFDAPPESDLDDGPHHADVAVGEDAFGRHSLHPPVPPAPEVPQASDRPSAALPQAFRHIDSGLGDMNVSEDLQHRYRHFDCVSSNHSHGHESNYPVDSHQFHISHHDSGLGDMDLDHEPEYTAQGDQHAHRSGRPTWSWNKASPAAEAEEQQPLPDVREEEGVDWQDVQQSEMPETDTEAGTDQGEHSGGVPLHNEQAKVSAAVGGDNSAEPVEVSRLEAAVTPSKPKDIDTHNGWAQQIAERILPPLVREDSSKTEKDIKT